MSGDTTVLKQLAKRSKWTVVAATLLKDLRARLAARKGTPESTSGSTHESLHTSESVAYIDSVVSDYVGYGELGETDLRGARVLELGTGDNVGVALRLLALGTQRVVTIDKFASRRDPAHQAKIYAAILAALPPPARAEVEGVLDLDAGAIADTERLNSLEGVAVEEAAERFERASFDLIVSRAVLEHLYDPDAAFAAMDSLLAPGGLMLHKVDFRDHGMFTDGEMHPLTFLTVHDRLYGLMSRHSGRPNRRLADWYRATLEQLGYETRLLTTHLVGRDAELSPYSGHVDLDPAADRATLELVNSIRPRLRPQYARLSDLDLATDGIFIVARKPAPTRPPLAARSAIRQSG